MARMARVVAPGIPHHVTQHGNRSQKVFFADSDYLDYKCLLAQFCRAESVQVWAYCLMPNHVHLVLVPKKEDGLHRSLAEAHRRYTRQINFREGWRGYLWQGRFASFPMDQRYLIAAVRYIELNPVRAGLCKSAESWPWSSAMAHLGDKDDDLVAVAPMLELVNNWRDYLSQAIEPAEYEHIRCHARTGRPLGSETFIEDIEQLTGRELKQRKPGPRRKAHESA
jgi:putative transposase